MSASVSCSREARIVSLMTCQFGRVEQKLSCSQRIAPLHSVIATGPSSAAMMEATVTSRGGRAREYPPRVPRWETRRPPWESCLRSLPTVGRGSRVSCASSRAVNAGRSSCAANCVSRTIP